MLRETANRSNRVVEFSIAKGSTISSILHFLEAKLPTFVERFDGSLINEDEITQECCIYLNREARNKNFMFHFQYKYNGSRRSSDMSIISAETYANTKPLFVIEAKRLPTPGSRRSKEYVRGNLGGIERFKRELHGANLTCGALLGFIQKETAAFWHVMVTEWITDLIATNTDNTIKWEDTDQLTPYAMKKFVTKYVSNSQRASGTMITLYHYWLDLT